MGQLKKQTLLIVLFCIVGLSAAFAQKAEFKKADDLYRIKSYAEAIPLYEKGLADSDNKSARSKLAFCYKMLNQMKKAEAQYALLVHIERARPDDFFNYGEVLMSQAKYNEAKIWFLKFHEAEPEEGKGLQMATACDQIPFITPLFPEVTVMEFPYNTDYDEGSPVFYNNEIVFSSDRKMGIKLMKKKSGVTGRDFIRLYSSSLDDQNQWKEPGSFSSKLNELNKNNANASFLPDGSEIFFTRNGNTSNRKSAFTLQLYTAQQEKGKWKDVEIVSVCKPAHNYMHPAISPDGNTLFFVSDKPGGKGGTDIFYSERKGDKWGSVIGLDSTINTSSHEGFPFMNTDGKLYFCSKGHIGFGGFDIFVTEKQEDGTWTKPVNVGQPINSAMDDISIFINAENTKGAFTSSRISGDDDIFLFSLDGSIPAANVPEFVSENTLESEVTETVKTEIEGTEMTVTEIENVEIPETAMVNTPTMETTIPEIKTEMVKVETPPVKEIPAPQTSAAKEIPDMETTVMEANKNTTDIPSNNKNTNVNIPENEVVANTSSEVSPSSNPDATTVNEPKMVAESDLTVSEIKTEPIAEAPPSIPVSSEDSKQSMKESTQQDIPVNTSSTEAMTSKAFQKAVNKGKYEVGMYYILENMKYFPGEYLLAPKMTLELEPIAEMLLEQPALKLEITVHTESIGYDENNLAVSQKRAKAIKNYLMYKGVEADRVVAIGLGETQLVNHCGNGVVCEEEEHLANQRVEVRVR